MYFLLEMPISMKGNFYFILGNLKFFALTLNLNLPLGGPLIFIFQAFWHSTLMRKADGEP
jgi:hypothetical protein